MAEQGAQPPGYRPPRSAEELVRRYQAGERWFAGTELPDGAVFRGADLSGANLRACWLSDADFRGADLRGTAFDGSNLKLSDFRDADLSGASLREALLCGAKVRGARIEGTVADGATFYGAPLVSLGDLLE
jgi:uncharacterized protein YjbI with pentapeptide repeats